MHILITGAAGMIGRKLSARLVKDRQLAAYEHTGFWQPMDTLREFNILNDLWSSGTAPWKVWP